MSTPDLTGQTILVTGAASGIGAAYSDACARAGASLLCMDLNVETLDVKADELRSRGTDVTTIPVDVADEAAVDRAFEALAIAGTTIDGAFLNAGINAGESFRSVGGELDHFPTEIWQRVLDINLSGFFFTLRRTAETMKASGRGAIVVTSSTSGIRAEPLVSYPYIAAKSAVTAVAKQAALELSKYGVRINIIAPGPFNTNIGGTAPRPQAKTELWERGIPMGRWGNPKELEAVALMLVSEGSSFMTGGVFVVDGGASVLTQVRADEL